MGEGKKQKLGDVRACARELFRRFLRPRFLWRRGCRTRWRLSAKSSPISRKNAQGLSRLLLLFSDGTALRERAQGRLGDCAALFLRWARRALLPLPDRLRASGGARFAAERNSRCQELQLRMPPVFRSVFAISRAPVPLFASSFFEERAERGTIS